MNNYYQSVHPNSYIGRFITINCVPFQLFFFLPYTEESLRSVFAAATSGVESINYITLQATIIICVYCIVYTLYILYIHRLYIYWLPSDICSKAQCWTGYSHKQGVAYIVRCYPQQPSVGTLYYCTCICTYNRQGDDGGEIYRDTVYVSSDDYDHHACIYTFLFSVFFFTHTCCLFHEFIK